MALNVGVRQVIRLKMPAQLDAVVITGAGRGLGKAVAMRCAQLAIPVLCISRSETAAATCAEITAAGGKAEFLIIDLRDASTAHSEVSSWVARSWYRKIAVVLTAGALGRPGGLIDADLTDWLTTYQTNVIGNLAVTKALLPVMLHAHFGRIVTIAGGGAAYAYPRFSGYALSKTAIVRATENLQAELADKGDFLTVCLAPGAMDTDMLKQVRAAGAEVRTTASVDEPVAFIEAFMLARACGFAGRFVHVRDGWRSALNRPGEIVAGDLWFLRRIEK
jgi:NAD(P)-dependent dehydrogenase (short-subunit alcohol dehydrogenase family)